MATTANYIVGVRINGDARGLSRAAQEALQAQRLLAGGSVREYQRMASARAQLGVRSEREVQREIQQTQAAYNRLARSGTMSFQEQRMAAKAMREEVTRLTNEMGRMTNKQKFTTGAKVVGATGTALVGAGMFMKPKLDRAMEYDTRLRMVANTGADVGATPQQREALRRAAGDAVINAIRYGGGNRDDALDAYNQMVGKGSTFTGQLPQQLLPDIMRAATAFQSSASDISAIAAAGMQNFGMGRNAQEMREWLNVAGIGSKLGGFEMRQQAQYLPEQMALAGQIGMRGKADFANLVMVNQAAEKTAGTPERAATNVKQLLTDLGSDHFRKRVGEATGLNFTKYAMENRLRNGTGMIDSAMELMDQQALKHPAYRQLQAQYAKAGNDQERREALQSAEMMLRGSSVAKFFHDQQSMQAVAGLLMNRSFIKDGQRQALSGTDELSRSFSFMAQGAQFQTNKLAIESANSMQTAMDKLTPTIGSLSSGVADLMKQYPGYTFAIMGATGALAGLAGTAGVLALALGRMPGKGGPIIPPKPTGGPLPKIEGVPGSAAGRFSNFAGKLGTVGMIASMAYGLFGTTDEEIAILKADRERREREKAKPPLLVPPAGGKGPYTAPSEVHPSMRVGMYPIKNPLPPEVLAMGSEEMARHLGKRMFDPDVLAQIAQPIAAPVGYRGAGFDDPRLLTRGPQSLADRLGGGASKGMGAERNSEVTVKVEVSAAQGLNVKTDTQTKGAPVTLRTDVGRSMFGAGQ